MNAAQAALRNWVQNLNGALAETGVDAGNVAINVLIGARAPAGVPHAAPDGNCPSLLEPPYPPQPT